jgi:hypothetical protein
VDTAEEHAQEEEGRSKAYHGVTVKDLIDAGLVRIGDELTYKYGLGGRNRKAYSSIVLEDGSIETEGEVFNALSYAALHVMQNAGSERQTVNGWWAWRTSDGEEMSTLRSRYITDVAFRTKS